jgi:AraC family transcriptional regulator, transcriptional activator of the genes for pyochelin and ferripyochelin receptors
MSKTNQHTIRISREKKAVLRALREQIISDPTKAYRIDALASSYQTDSSYLMRSFKQCFGTGIHELVREQRLQLAARLLLNDNPTVKAVCYDCGYKNVKHFSIIFKKRFGVTPHSYQELHASG